jgi:NADH:ubiquinone oxidoreductase subunit E
MVVQICIGSSCYLKGSQDLVALFQKTLEKHSLTDEVTLTGSFCTGKCNREGVTVTVDDTVFTGVTAENFSEFFENNVLNKLKKGV